MRHIKLIIPFLVLTGCPEPEVVPDSAVKQETKADAKAEAKADAKADTKKPAEAGTKAGKAK